MVYLESPDEIPWKITIFSRLMVTPWDPMDRGSWENRCQDLNDWCPVGPGARRALNRLHGRPTKENCYSALPAALECFGPFFWVEKPGDLTDLT
jgi:hypothetical protein